MFHWFSEELYLTLLARVAFPDSLSTCPVPFLDLEEGLCVYEIPMLGPLGDLPLHPGGNSATLVARKLSEEEPVQLMRCPSELVFVASDKVFQSF